MPIKIKPTSEIKARLGIEPNGRVQKFFTNTCYKHMDKYVPMDNGDLRTIVDIQPDSITYESPYAEYQYYGMRKDGTHVVKNYTTPGTGTYWNERMVSAEIEDVVKEVQDYINHGGK
jgi:hypothetical protein